MGVKLKDITKYFRFQASKLKIEIDSESHHNKKSCIIQNDSNWWKTDSYYIFDIFKTYDCKNICGNSVPVSKNRTHTLKTASAPLWNNFFHLYFTRNNRKWIDKKTPMFQKKVRAGNIFIPFSKNRNLNNRFFYF